MARLEQLVYRSRLATIVDVLTYGSAEIPLGAPSVAFVRSGYFAKPGLTATIVDANYAVFGGERECLRADACTHICACTVISCPGFEAPTAAAGCVLTSPHAFLLNAKLLMDARLQRGNPESDALQLLTETRSEDAPPYACSRPIIEMRRLINETLSKRISLEAIGRAFYMSPFTVSRQFHRETGMRLRDYALRLRLRKALNLLMQSRKTVTSVAMDLGFYDEPHFSKAFRGEFGISPQSVRKYAVKSAFC